MINEEALETLLDNAENGCVDIEEVKLVFAELQNNSDEDCISRKAVLDEFYDHFADDDLASIDDYENYTKIVKALPSIQPKTGHWIVYEDCEGKTRRCVCDRCGHETGDYTWKNPNFCEECGAKMVEPQGSEE